MTNEQPRPVACRKCGASIVFLPTAKGRSMPVDAETVAAGEVVFDHKRHRSHFATCTDPNSFRRPR